MENSVITAHERELYINTVSSIVTHVPTKAPHDFAPQIVDWLSSHMPEELDGNPLDQHAVEVALVHLGWVDP